MFRFNNIHLLIFCRHAFGGLFDTHNSFFFIYFFFLLILSVSVCCSYKCLAVRSSCSCFFFNSLQIFTDAFGLTQKRKKGQQASVCYFYFSLVCMCVAHNFFLFIVRHDHNRSHITPFYSFVDTSLTIVQCLKYASVVFFFFAPSHFYDNNEKL